MSASAFRRRAKATDPLVTGEMLLRRLLDEHAGLLQQLNRLRASQPQGDYDALTGLGTRHHFERRLNEELSRAEGNRSYVGSLVVMDIADVPEMRARYGRRMGDRALRWVAKVLKERLRMTDISCRGNGDQFMAILCDTDAFGTGEVVARLRGEMAGAQGYRWCPASVSFGTAAWPDDALTISALMAIAAVRLAEDKQFRRAQERPRLRLLP
jgi:diguanylate cyclase (GGDEF)-like protein